ncbi:MAG: hypothetical protein ACYTHM_20015 [Planctomycetota bacterium]|jgi:anti-sigma factor RsiW
MEDHEKIEPEVREILKRLRFTSPEDPGGGEVDPMRLASYLDGSATPEEVEALERAMLADPALLETVQALRESLDAGPAAVPEGFADRVKRALGAGGGPPAEAMPASPRPARIPFWQLAVAAAVVFLIGFLAFQLGRDYAVEEETAEADLHMDVGGEWGWNRYNLDHWIEISEE